MQAVWKQREIAVLADSIRGESALESRSLALWSLTMHRFIDGEDRMQQTLLRWAFACQVRPMRACREGADRRGRTEESPPIGREARAATLYSVGSARDPDHEAADALRRRSSETTGPFSVRHEGHALTRAPSPRIDIACQQTFQSSLDCRPEHDAVRHEAGGSQAPKSDQQLSGKRDDHRRLAGALGAGGPF